MTRFLDHGAQPSFTPSGNMLLDTPVEDLPSPEVNDGSLVEQRLNLTVDVLIAAAEEAKLQPDQDNMYFQTNADGQSLTFGRESISDESGEVVSRVLRIRDPENRVCFGYSDFTSTSGRADFTVRRETLGGPVEAEISGAEGRPLSSLEIAVSQDFAEAVVDVAEQVPVANPQVIKEIVGPITVFEAKPKSALSSWLAKIGIRHAAA